MKSVTYNDSLSTLIVLILTIPAVHTVRRMKMIDKIKDVLLATAIGIGLAALLVAWWSA